MGWAMEFIPLAQKDHAIWGCFPWMLMCVTDIYDSTMRHLMYGIVVIPPSVYCFLAINLDG